MAETSTTVTPGTGKTIDGWDAGGGMRQAIVLADSAVQGGVAPVDAVKGLSTNQTTKLAGEDLTNDRLLVEQRFSYQNITTSATTTVKTGSGALQGLVVGDAGSAWQAIIYDNTAGSGTIIGTIKPTATGYISFNAAYATGLTIVTSGTTAGNITAIYR